MSWCTVTEVMKDLQMPQRAGRLRCHLDENFIVVGERAPPNLTGTEETEEAYIKHGYSNEDITAPCIGPDLSLIKEMMNMLNDDVVNDEVVSGEQAMSNSILEISKMNPSCPEFIPGNTASGDHNPSSGEIKDIKRKELRNVALKSILKNIHKTQTSVASIEHENVTNTHNDNNKSKLLKPSDFISIGSSELEQKITPPIAAKIDCQVSAVTKTDTSSNRKLILQPVMFKKKTVRSTPEKKDNSDDAKSTSSSSSSPYVPSPFATQLYHEYMERSHKKKEAANSDFVDIILNKMKEYNFQIQQPKLEDHPGLTEDEFKKLQHVLLPSHRHQQHGDCVVCLLRTISETKTKVKLSSEEKCLEAKLEDN